nr:uncharacterized protein LOC124810852 [Hydra vulgaris]
MVKQVMINMNNGENLLKDVENVTLTEMSNNCKFIVYNGNPMDLMANQCKMDDNKTDNKSNEKWMTIKEDASDNEKVNEDNASVNEECVHSDSDDEFLEGVQKKDKELAHQCEKLYDYLEGLRNEYCMDDIQEFKSAVCVNLNNDKHNYAYDKSIINFYLKVCSKLIIKCNKSIDRLQEQIKKEKEYQEERNDTKLIMSDLICEPSDQKKQKLEEDEVQLEPELLKEIQTLQQLADIDDVDVIMLLKSSTDYDGLIKNIEMNFSTARLHLEMKELGDIYYSKKKLLVEEKLKHTLAYNRYRVICKLYKMLSKFDKQVRYLNDDYMSDIQYLGIIMNSKEKHDKDFRMTYDEHTDESVINLEHQKAYKSLKEILLKEILLEDVEIKYLREKFRYQTIANYFVTSLKEVYWTAQSLSREKQMDAISLRKIQFVSMEYMLHELHKKMDCEFKDEYNWGSLVSKNKRQVPIEIANSRKWYYDKRKLTVLKLNDVMKTFSERQWVESTSTICMMKFTLSDLYDKALAYKEICGKCKIIKNDEQLEKLNVPIPKDSKLNIKKYKIWIYEENINNKIH